MSRVALVLGAVVWLTSCERDSRPRQVEQLEAIPEVVDGVPPAGPSAKVGPGAAPTTKSVEPTGHAVPGATGTIQVGMKRQALLAALGACAHRTWVEPAAGKGTRTVEVYQPREGECRTRFGARRFFLVGDQLDQIVDGVDQPTVGARATGRTRG